MGVKIYLELKYIAIVAFIGMRQIKFKYANIFPLSWRIKVPIHTKIW